MTTTPPLGAQLDLSEAEMLWSLNYDVFLERGYKLRDRYKPGAVDRILQLADMAPEQENEALLKVAENAGVFDAPDHDSLATKGIDAVRTNDGSYVWIKRYALRDHEDADSLLELVLNLALASEPATTNHCLPLLDHFHHEKA